MGSIYNQRNADVATIDSRDILDDDGELTPDRAAMTVPDRKVCGRAIVASGNDFAATGVSNVHARLLGTGIDGAPVRLSGPGYGVNTATGNYRDDAAVITPLGRSVTNTQTITVEGEFSGAGDVDFEMAVGVEYRDTPIGLPVPSAEDYPLWPMTLEGDITAVDTATALSTEGSVTAPDRVIPPGYNSIWGISVGFAADHAGAGSAVYIVHLSSVTGWLADSDQRIPVGGGGGQAVQAGADPTATSGYFELTDANIGVKPGTSATVNGIMAGDDLGTASMVVNLLLSPRKV